MERFTGAAVAFGDRLMRIAALAADGTRASGPVTVNSVAAQLPLDATTHPDLVIEEARCVASILNDQEFIDSVRQAATEIGKVCIAAVLPDVARAEAMIDNPYFAIATDFESLASTMRKGDTITIGRGITLVAEVVDVTADALPFGRAINIVTTILKIVAPPIAVWTRFQRENNEPLETALSLALAHEIGLLDSTLPASTVTSPVQYEMHLDIPQRPSEAIMPLEGAARDYFIRGMRRIERMR